MKLYHYTSVTLFHSIMNSSLKNGHLRLQDGRIISPVVWLTSSPLASGHGLLDGNEKLTKSNMDYIERIEGRKLKIGKTQNKMQIRISICSEKVKNKKDLIRFKHYMQVLGQHKLYIKQMGVSCYYDINKFNQLSDSELLKIFKKTKTKEDTWYLYFGEIYKEDFLSVEYQVSENNFIPYSYEEHGRKHIEEAGIFSPTLNEIECLRSETGMDIQPYNIRVFCGNLQSPPSASIFLQNTFINLSIKNGAVLDSLGDDKDIQKIHPAFYSWLSLKQKELECLWLKAVKVCEHYHNNFQLPDHEM